MQSVDTDTSLIDPYQGFRTEEQNEKTMNLDELDAAGIVRVMNREDYLVPAALKLIERGIARLVEAAAEKFRWGGRLIYVGAGTSGRLGILDASEQFPTFGVPEGRVVAIIAGGEKAIRKPVEGAEDSREDGAKEVADICAGALDIVVGLTASGNTPFVLGALEEAKKRGAVTALFTCNPAFTKGGKNGRGAKNAKCAENTKVADHVLVADVGPEVVTGSTRLKAGTVTKLFLNMLSTGVMVLNGKVYGNLMVDVKPSNKKLVARAKRIMKIATGLEDEKSESLLIEAGDLKLAIFMHLTGLSKVDAGALLEKAGGHIKRALSLYNRR
jgi:N-acetylmuramic acid 6-phosphate etherase